MLVNLKTNTMLTNIVTPSPKTYIGRDSSKRLDEILKDFSPKKILLIADPHLVKLGLHKGITDLLEKSKYNYILYSEIIPEPTLKTGQDVIDFSRDGDFSLIIGFGGGSALDMSKLAAVFVENPGPLGDYLNLSVKRKITNKGIPKILIPTTSGTGTEVTNISVLSLEKNKDVVVHDYLIADVAIVDPVFTLTVPRRITASTGIDALTHAIESYISVNKNSISDAWALQSIRLIGSSLKVAVKDGNNIQAREAMSYGSYLAGLAFFNAGVGAVHALAYPLGAQFHVPHGESNAVLLPYVMNYIKSSCKAEMKVIFESLTGLKVVGENAEEECVARLKNLVHDIGIHTTLKDYGITEASIPSLVTDALKQKRLLARCPMKMQDVDILEIYESAYRGYF